MKAWAIVALLLAQSGKVAVDTHVAAAKAAAGQEHTSIFGLCTAPAPAVTPAPAQTGQRASTQPPGQRRSLEHPHRIGDLYPPTDLGSKVL